MTGINYVTDEHGEKTALLIDLKQLRRSGNNEQDVMDFMEDLEDILAIELSKSEEEYSDWDDAKKRLQDKGIID